MIISCEINRLFADENAFGRGTRVVRSGNRTLREQVEDQLVLSGGSAPAACPVRRWSAGERPANHMEHHHVARRFARHRRVRVLLGDLRTRTEKNHNVK